MQDRVDEPPIVGCPGCDLPLEAKERTSVTVVCATCGRETKRTVAAKRTELGGYHLWRFKQVASRLLARTGRGASCVGAFYAR
jgi:hypothetical protein